jgi:hypothetical protein
MREFNLAPPSVEAEKENKAMRKLFLIVLKVFQDLAIGIPVPRTK